MIQWVTLTSLWYPLCGMRAFQWVTFTILWFSFPWARMSVGKQTKQSRSKKKSRATEMKAKTTKKKRSKQFKHKNAAPHLKKKQKDASLDPPTNTPPKHTTTKTVRPTKQEWCIVATGNHARSNNNNQQRHNRQPKHWLGVRNHVCAARR